MDGICIVYWRIKYLAHFDKTGKLKFNGKVPLYLPFRDLRVHNQSLLMDGHPITLPYRNDNRGLLIVRIAEADHALELFEMMRDEMKEIYDEQLFNEIECFR